MAVVNIPAERKTLEAPADIKAFLTTINIGFEQWDGGPAYKDVCDAAGYKAVDILREILR